MPLLPDEAGDVDFRLPGPMVHKDPVALDKLWCGANRPNQHTISDSLNLDLATRHKLKPLSQELGHDKPPRCINGSLHA